MNLFVNFNANPKNKLGCDCVVRAISTAMKEDWITVYRELCDLGAELYDMPFNKDVFGEYLIDNIKSIAAREANNRKSAF